MYHCSLQVKYRKRYFQTKTEERLLGLVKKKNSKFFLGYLILKPVDKQYSCLVKPTCVFRLDDIKESQCHLSRFTGL